MGGEIFQAGLQARREAADRLLRIGFMNWLEVPTLHILVHERQALILYTKPYLSDLGSDLLEQFYPVQLLNLFQAPMHPNSKTQRCSTLTHFMDLLYAFLEAVSNPKTLDVVGISLEVIMFLDSPSSGPRSEGCTTWCCHVPPYKFSGLQHKRCHHIFNIEIISVSAATGRYAGFTFHSIIRF